MDESEEERQAKRAASLAQALEEAISQLSEVAVIDLRRRLNTASAIIRSAGPVFHRTATKKRELERRERSTRIVYAFCLGGLALSFLFDLEVIRQGKSIYIVGGIIFLLYVWDTVYKVRAYERDQARVEELLYRWVANGGSESHFWSLRNQVDDDLGGVDFETVTYRGWWYEMKADLLDSVNGDTPGTGHWRSAFRGW